MTILDVTEATFARDVVAASREQPVVVDFWAAWCGPCRVLTPALEKATRSREGKVTLAKVDVDANQELAARFRVQGIPAVKAFRGGEVVSEFVGAQPPAAVEAFFDRLVPPGVEELAKARLLHEQGDADGALELLEPLQSDFAAQGLAARIRLERNSSDPPLAEALAALDRGEREVALERLLELLPDSADGRREELRRLIVGLLSELEPGDPVARDYRRRLAVALY